MSTPLISSIQWMKMQRVHAAQKQIRAEVHQTNYQKMPKKLEVASLRIINPLLNRTVRMMGYGWMVFVDYCHSSHRFWIQSAQTGILRCFMSALWMAPQPPSISLRLWCTLQHRSWFWKGAFPIIRHNRIRDLLADFLTEVCLCVAVEPVLQSHSSEQFQLRSTNV